MNQLATRMAPVMEHRTHVADRIAAPLQTARQNSSDAAGSQFQAAASASNAPQLSTQETASETPHLLAGNATFCSGLVGGESVHNRGKQLVDLSQCKKRACASSQTRRRQCAMKL
jgi:hypothetical protein